MYDSIIFTLLIIIIAFLLFKRVRAHLVNKKTKTIIINKEDPSKFIEIELSESKLKNILNTENSKEQNNSNTYTTFANLTTQININDPKELKNEEIPELKENSIEETEELDNQDENDKIAEELEEEEYKEKEIEKETPQENITVDRQKLYHDFIHYIKFKKTAEINKIAGKFENKSNADVIDQLRNVEKNTDTLGYVDGKYYMNLNNKELNVFYC